MVDSVGLRLCSFMMGTHTLTICSSSNEIAVATRAGQQRHLVLCLSHLGVWEFDLDVGYKTLDFKKLYVCVSSFLKR